jgi:hypothetical protein
MGNNSKEKMLNPLTIGRLVKTKQIKIPALSGIFESTEGSFQIDRAELVVKRIRDKEKFMKVFPEGMKVILSLTKKAQRVLDAFLEEYASDSRNFGKETIYFNYKTAKYDHHYDRPQNEYYLALKELKEKKMIIRHPQKQHYWFINTSYVFMGDRLDIMNNNER